MTLTNKNRISYGVGDLYGGGAFFIIGALFLVFLTDVIELDPTLAGTILMVGKIWDAVTDPTMGYISDKTNSKYGRRRFYFLIGIVPVIISFALLWIPLSFDLQWIKFIYYLFVYVLFSTVFTMVMIPYNSMPAEMTSDYKERSRLIGTRMFFSYFGALLGAVLPLTIINNFENEGIGYSVMGISLAVIYGICFLIVFLGTKESQQQKVKQKDVNYKDIYQIFKDFKDTFRNRSLIIHIYMFICAYVAMDIFNAMLLYIIRDYFNMLQYYQVILGLVVITEIISLYFVTKECSKKGNALTYRRHMITWLIGVLILGSLSATIDPKFLLICAVIVGIGLSGAVMVPYNMLAFVTDADELITKRRREGTYAGVMTFLRKIAQAIALFLLGVGLDLIGYKPNSELVPTTLLGMRLLFIVIPSLLMIAGFILSFKFRISPKNHKVLLSEIERLKSGGKKEDVTEDTKHICEEITGIDYQSLWMN